MERGVFNVILLCLCLASFPFLLIIGTYVLDELCVLDLKTMTWFEYHDMPPRYNHSATMIGNKMYIYAGKDEQGNTVSDLFMINLMKMPYIPHLVLNASQPSNENMVLLKSQHFCDTACGKLLMFGRYLINNKGSDHTNTSHKNTATESQNSSDSTYSLWMLDLDSLQWERQECGGHFDIGGWNYFTIINEHSGLDVDVQTEISINNLLFLGNTDPYRPQGYDHFRDALLIHGESLGLYDITEPTCSSEFIQLLDNQELSDFTIVTTEGRAIHAHQVILLTRWTYFSHLLKTGRVKTEKELIIPEHYDVVILFLKFLYSDCLDEAASWQTICRLLVLSNHYKVHRLKKLCCQRLYKYHMSVDSCGVIFEKALQAEEMGLKSLTLNYMFENYGSILKTNILLSLSPSTRDAFLESVPEGAKLDIHRSKWTANRDHASMLDNQHNTNTNTIISVTPINHHSTSTTHALYNSSRHHSQSTHSGINASTDYFISPNVTSTATSTMANNHHANISHIPDYPQNRMMTRTDMLTNHDLIPISSTSANNTTDSMIVEV